MGENVCFHEYDFFFNFISMEICQILSLELKGVTMKRVDLDFHAEKDSNFSE